MPRNRSSISKAKSYAGIGEFWDTHDVSKIVGTPRPVTFEVDIQSEVELYALDLKLSTRVVEVARRRGISPETLVNLWIQEKLGEHEGAIAKE